MTRKLYVKSYGCQMNVYDSHRMADTLAPEGFVETATPDDADLIILNTCHIREKAAEKVYSELGRMRVLKDGRRARRTPREGRRRRLRRAGRRRRDHPPRARGRSRGRAAELSPAAGDAGARRARQGSSTPSFRSRTSSAISRRRAARRSASAASRPSSPCRKAATSSAPSASCPTRAAPKCRGRSPKIVAEAERLADAGVREITLLGQNVNAYHGEGTDGRASTLGRLMHRLAEIPGIARLRYSTSHPRDMDDSLIAAHRDLPALMPQLHLPVQSGSDRILEAMNRRHTRADYLRTIERLRRGAARYRVLVGLHRRLPGRDRGRFPRHAAADRRGRLCQRLLVQIFAAARHAGRRHGATCRRP